MLKLIVLLGIVANIVASPVSPVQRNEIKGGLDNFLLPLLFPNQFKNENQIQNSVLNQIQPFLSPLSNVIQPALNPALEQVNADANKVPIVGNVITDCTNNILACLFTNLDNALEDGKN